MTQTAGLRALFPRKRGNPLAPGDLETDRSPARRRFAATSDDQGDDTQFPLSSVRSLALQLRSWQVSESMGNHDSAIVDAGSVD